jgi:hypothetical protein
MEPGAYVDTLVFVNVSDDVGNALCQVALTIGDRMTRYEWLMDDNPGWTMNSPWAWGVPQGEGGTDRGYPDPVGGYSGDRACAYNLHGDYNNGIPEKHATTGMLDCTDLYGVHLTFARWLGVDDPLFDHAYIRISYDGLEWIDVWANESEITDNSWQLIDLDISQWADNQPSVYLRWTMGETDLIWKYCGWNIDDVRVSGCLYTVPEPPFICGDINGDQGELLDIADLVWLTDYMFNSGPEPPDMRAADMDASGGVIDIADLVVLVDYMFSGGPYPVCLE